MKVLIYFIIFFRFEKKSLVHKFPPGIDLNASHKFCVSYISIAMFLECVFSFHMLSFIQLKEVS